MGNFHVINHPLMDHKLSFLRNKDTQPWMFRRLIKEITYLLISEVTRDLETVNVDVETPLMMAKTKRLKRKIVVVPVLRAGLGIMEGVLDILPRAQVGFLGMKRNEKTYKPEVYFKSLPDDNEDKNWLVVDPMLATGGSANETIDVLKSEGVKRIKIMVILSAPEGVDLIRKKHPDVDIYTAALDEKLNEKAFIMPGLGDAGDRLFGTML